MRFTKFDIGADIISILTRGMYPDPKDALREYVQNGVDAKAKHIDVKIRQNNIIVHDNGIGMDYETLRRAARIGVSDKNPSKDVGFMGIGIYSAYHLCDTLIITTKKKDNNPNKLTMDFSGMKSMLQEQRTQRLEGLLDNDKQIDLQSLLEKFIQITDNESLDVKEFPNDGTRVELRGVSEYFYSEISNFEITAKYLQDVVPLKFNSDVFKFASEIEEQIIEACNKNNSNIEMIDLTLQVNSQTQSLYRPYADSDFESNMPLSPKIVELRGLDDTFYGVIWGCLNSERKKIKRTELRGFMIKKQGFAIGKRSDVVRQFPRANTFFDRYIGEVIITNPQLLPNAARNDIEYSPLREKFFTVLTDAAAQYDEYANKFQEDCKADEILNDIIEKTKSININVNQNQQNSDVLLRDYTELSKYEDILSKRIDTKRIKFERFPEARELHKEIKKLLCFIKERLVINNQRKSGEQNPTQKKSVPKNTPTTISRKLNKLNVSGNNSEIVKKYESLLDLIDDLEFKYDEDIRILLEIIDERFIQALASTKDDYYQSLENLRQEFFNEEE